MYDIYNGTGMQMALFFACLIYLFFQKKEKEKRFLFLGYTLLFFLICFFPVTAKIIMEVCIGKSVYWRMFWLLPVTIVTAYTASVILMQAEGKGKRSTGDNIQQCGSQETDPAIDHGTASAKRH